MSSDSFKHIAPHYNSMMDHIDYERWVVVTTMLAELCPDEDFCHLDIACGTGSLLRELVDHRWASYGIDLSIAMLQEAKTQSEGMQVAQADMCHLPFKNHFAMATCFFDSLNFVTHDGGLQQTLTSMYDALNDIGVLVFDVITERMVVDHFANKDWVDNNSGHKARWSGKYDAENRIITNKIRVNKGERSVMQERVYSQDEIRAALMEAGFIVLGIFDTENWREPDDETLRLDIVATKNTDDVIHLKFESIEADIQALLAD